MAEGTLIDQKGRCVLVDISMSLEQSQYQKDQAIVELGGDFLARRTSSSKIAHHPEQMHNPACS